MILTFYVPKDLGSPQTGAALAPLYSFRCSGNHRCFLAEESAEEPVGSELLLIVLHLLTVKDLFCSLLRH